MRFTKGDKIRLTKEYFIWNKRYDWVQDVGDNVMTVREGREGHTDYVYSVEEYPYNFYEGWLEKAGAATAKDLYALYT